MSSCHLGEFLCQDPQYPDFDRIAQRELKNPPSVQEIINQSVFCTYLPLEDELILGNMTHQMFLKALNTKNGIYHLWVDFENCTDHDTHTMKCIYVGKGFAEVRINNHVFKKKLKNTGVSIYASFYECSNRMSKYLEQLFLDTYKFSFNKNENTGTNELFAVWDDERYSMGTEANAVSALSNIRCMDDILK